MKWLFIGISAVLAAAGIATILMLRRGDVRDNDEIDGGVVKRYWDDVPKVIDSTEIQTFRCELSFFAVFDAEELGNRVYRLEAGYSDGEVFVKYDWRSRQGESGKAEYKADADFMVRLQEIVTGYDFASHNGYYHSVSGLPDMYGEIIDITYESGESIYAYDNQSGFLPLEAGKALVTLFCGANNNENK